MTNPAKEPDLDTNGGLLYYLYNGRHTVSELTNRHGEVVESYRYDAFGGILTGVTAPYNTVGYTGQHYDDKTGLLDMDARWYDPNIGRFLSQDTWSGTLDVPWTQNKYAYVGNNPINMWDPTGNVPEWVRLNWKTTIFEDWPYEYYYAEQREGEVSSVTGPDLVQYSYTDTDEYTVIKSAQQLTAEFQKQIAVYGKIEDIKEIANDNDTYKYGGITYLKHVGSYSSQKVLLR